MRSLKLFFIKLIIASLCFLCIFFSYGAESFVFEQISTHDGLSSGTINSILKDSRGFMWFSTDDGLNRFDGYTFKHFNASNPGWFLDKSLQFLSIVEDDYGRLWIATSEGLYFFDRRQEKIINFLNYSGLELPDNLINESINTLLYDSRGYLWVGSYNGIVRIKIKENILPAQRSDISIFQNSPNSDFAILNNQVFSIVEDDEQQIWIASNSDILECFNYESASLLPQKIEIPNLTNWNYLNKRLAFDHNNDLWIATQGLGAIFWDRENNTFSQFESFQIDGNDLNISMLRTIIIDSNDRVWFGTDGNGLVVYDKDNMLVSNYRSDIYDKSKISSNAIYSLYEDDKNNFWVGTYLTGVNKVISNRLSFGVQYGVPNSNNRLNHSVVTNFCEDQNGLIWISTDGGGLNVYEPDSGSFRHLMHEPGNKNSLSINTAITLLCDSSNQIWIGTYNGGLNIYDQELNNFQHYRFDSNDSTSISSNHVWGFAQDKWGNMWVATVSSGLNLMKKDSDSFIRYQISDIDHFGPDQITSNAITHLYIDNDNRLWIATEWGLDMIELDKVDFTQERPELHFNHVINSNNDHDIREYRFSYVNQDALGNIWVGTKGAGFLKLDVENHNHTYYTVNEGLAHNVVNGILFDDDNNLWISTNQGISYLNVETQQFNNFDSSYGLQSDVFMKTACLKAGNGVMYFGGINGFNVFHPSEIIFDYEFYEPEITDFRLFNHSVPVGADENGFYLEKSIVETNSIHLNYRHNDITFEFSAMDYANPEKIFYLYQLEGFDRDWIMTDAKMRIAKYTNLNPGHYTFKVKASSQDSSWSESFTSLQLNIKPPWWKTRLFILFAAITLGIILLLIYYYRIYSLQKQQIILQKTVDKKTKQLQTMNHDLENAVQTKDKFFSIIAHDLISPFNSIMGLSDLLVSEYHRMDDDERLNIAGIINKSSGELFELLENLLHWSRSERGMLNFSPQKVSLNVQVERVVSLLSISLENKNIDIEKQLLEGDCWVMSDERMLNAILRNLMSNAIKFTPVGGKVKIKVEVIRNQYSISVIDNGVGIENTHHLFNKNFTITTPGTNNEKGTGLGLMLVKELVEKQGGIISVQSNVGKGSAFTFTLPAWDEK